MAYEISRNYDTDRSRSDVRTILANVAKELNDSRGREVPTKTVFETPELQDEDGDRFAVAVRPTVTEAGFEAEDLIPSGVVYHGLYVRLHGVDKSGEKEVAHVTVREARGNERDPDIETLAGIWTELGE